MPDIAIWQDKKQRQAFVAKGTKVFEERREELSQRGEVSVVAIEPTSGEVFVGRTLGEANRAASERYLDKWIYFVRLDDPTAAMPLPAW